MLTVKQGIKLSAIIDKLALKITDPKAGPEQVGADLMMQIVTKAHRAEQEIYGFIADVKKIDTQEAQEADLVDFIQGMLSDTGAMSFFKSAVTSKAQD